MTNKGEPRGSPLWSTGRKLAVDDGNDLVSLRVDHDDLVADEDEVISPPFRVDRHDIGRKRMEGHVVRYAGADRDVEIHMLHRGDVLLLDHAGDLGALLGGELGAGAGLSDCPRRALGTLGFGVHVGPVFATLGLHVALVFAAFGLLAVLIVTAFGLHFLVAAFAVLRAHALRFLTLLLGALAA